MTDVQFNRIAKALADPQRFAILRRIAGSRKEPACRDLVQEFEVTAATISHHLKELSTAGLVEGRKDGQCMYLSARPNVLEDYLNEIARRLLPREKAARS